jgi:hypothetical protein
VGVTLISGAAMIVVPRALDLKRKDRNAIIWEQEDNGLQFFPSSAVSAAKRPSWCGPIGRSSSYQGTYQRQSFPDLR